MTQTEVHPILSPIEGWLLAHPWLGALAVAGAVVVVGETLHRIFRLYVLRLIERVARRSSASWDDAFLQARMPHRLAWVVPLLVWYYGTFLVPAVAPEILDLVRRLLVATVIVVLVRTIAAALDGVNRIYNELPRAKERPIKGFLQVGSLVVHLAGAILVVAALMAEDPRIFLAGMGAFAAVLLLVFRDSILSFVAGVQIASNDLLRVGDWIEMPQMDADGDVVDIALNSVRIKNFDHTFTVVPTHKFLEHSFRNWRGMQDSGGRRIKRSFHLDQRAIRFLTEEEVAAFGRWELLREHVASKSGEIESYNRSSPPTEGIDVPAHRRLTNVGMLRAYLVEYLRRHPGLRKDMTLLVRQLAPGPEGLPIEIYVFAADVRWVEYEGLQSDIFDHVLAMLPRFDLRIFQGLTGGDLVAVAREMASE